MRNAYLEKRPIRKYTSRQDQSSGTSKDILCLYARKFYGLCTSVLKWSERISKCLQSMQFRPCKAAPDTWIKNVAISTTMLLFMLMISPLISKTLNTLSNSWQASKSMNKMVQERLSINWFWFLWRQRQHGMHCSYHWSTHWNVEFPLDIIPIQQSSLHWKRKISLSLIKVNYWTMRAFKDIRP